jgi:hypothetical protein
VLLWGQVDVYPGGLEPLSYLTLKGFLLVELFEFEGGFAAIWRGGAFRV